MNDRSEDAPLPWREDAGALVALAFVLLAACLSGGFIALMVTTS